ncbi:E3 ubiquitin-protein ligase Dma1p [[Candida] jaroonii]|uniref:E3 ubiquitin-protein ligase Dma1p n=1 Tax=[Candida] jaroonii TaxID=467808 RepID=A0ACA9YDB6_9ASCO|nr:E3 ubiquitin-protein ligase Dma1p [[Candida] jaroonii]
MMANEVITRDVGLHNIKTSLSNSNSNSSLSDRIDDVNNTNTEDNENINNENTNIENANIETNIENGVDASTNSSNNQTNNSINNENSNGSNPSEPNIPNPGEGRTFGLNFLSSFSPLRSQPQSPTRNFMSNSPTVGNFNNVDEDADATMQPDTPIDEHDIDQTMVRDDREQQESTPPLEECIEEGQGEGTHEGDIIASNKDEEDDGKDKDGFYSLRLTPLIDHSSSNSGLYFAPVIRKAKSQNSISIGRYTEKNKSAAHAPQGSNAPIVFKSKVVSRTHALFQCNEEGQWFIKDCKSSSGTFLNHIRLSPASQESSLMPLIDGDIIQLGMDYRGGTEEVYRCVKMRCEFNKSWQRKVNQFNLEIHKKFKNLSVKETNPLKNDELSECAICLLKLEPCQAIFISPCSHSWHYKCIRPIIIKSYPQFYCPNCRSMCDLETDIDDD